MVYIPRAFGGVILLADQGVIDSPDDWYVSISGNDGNDGKTTLTPFLTLAKANSVVSPGSTVHIMPGTYTGGSITISTGGTPLQHITWKADQPGSVFLSMTGGSDPRVLYVPASYIDFYGLDITGDKTIAGFGVWTSGNFITLNQCTIHDIYFATNTYTKLAGVEQDTVGVGLVINACTIYNIGDGTQSTHTAYVINSGGSFTMNNSVCYGIASAPGVDYQEGIDVQAALPGWQHICNNLIIGGYHTIRIGSTGSVVYDNALVTNNILVGATDVPIKELVAGGISKRGNNILYRANCYYLAGTAYDISDVSSTTSNDAYGLHTDPQVSTTLSALVTQPSFHPQRHPWATAPTSVGIATFISGVDFTLAPGSPCIDSGWYQSSAYPTDRSGNSRASGGIDIGPYEYQQVVNEPVVVIYDPGVGQVPQVQNNNQYHNTISVSVIQPYPVYSIAYLIGVLMAAVSDQEIPWVGSLQIQDTNGTPITNAYSSASCEVSGPFLMNGTVQKYTQRFERGDGSLYSAGLGTYEVTYPIHFTTDQVNHYTETWFLSDLCGNQDIIIVDNAVGA